MASPPPSSSEPSTGANGDVSGPKSPSPDEEPRGRARTRQPPQTQTQTTATGAVNNAVPSLEGYHTFESMGRKFTIESRWKLVSTRPFILSAEMRLTVLKVREMGIGAFGAVVSAQDTISGEHVAIKQVNRVYEKARRPLLLSNFSIAHSASSAATTCQTCAEGNHALTTFSNSS